MKRINGTEVHNNSHGYRGVEWRRHRQKFSARICGKNPRGRWLGYFSTKEEAAKAYDAAAIEEYGDNAFLNFPDKGENKVIKSRLNEGICPRDHDMSIHGGINSRGRKFCKKCNADAAKRYYKRIKEQRTELKGEKE